MKSWDALQRDSLYLQLRPIFRFWVEVNVLRLYSAQTPAQDNLILSKFFGNILANRAFKAHQDDSEEPRQELVIIQYRTKDDPIIGFLLQAFRFYEHLVKARVIFTF